MAELTPTANLVPITDAKAFSNAAVFGPIPHQPPDDRRKFADVRRRAPLVVDDARREPLPRAAPHRAHEARPPAVQPLRADHRPLGAARRQRPLAGELAPPVRALRVGRIFFAIRPIERAVEHVVRAHVHHPRAHGAGFARHQPHRVAIDQRRVTLVLLGGIDARPRGAVDHPLRTVRDCRSHGCIIGDVELAARERSQGHARRRRRLHRARQHPAGAEEHDLHDVRYSASAARYASLSTRVHHSRWPSYQRTVLAIPSSHVCSARHPSSPVSRALSRA